MTKEEKYIKLALKQAKKAQLIDEVPIGCVVVKDDKVIARAHNRKEKKNFVKQSTLHLQSYEHSPFFDRCIYIG